MVYEQPITHTRTHTHMHTHTYTISSSEHFISNLMCTFVFGCMYVCMGKCVDVRNVMFLISCLFLNNFALYGSVLTIVSYARVDIASLPASIKNW